LFLESFIPTPRYSGVIKIGHFSTPRKRQRNLYVLKNKIKKQQNIIKVLRMEKRRLVKKILTYQDLLENLCNSQLLSENACMELTVSFLFYLSFKEHLK